MIPAPAATDLPRTRVIVAGASGLIGSALTARLRSRGCEVVRLVRRPVEPNESDAVAWDPLAGQLDPATLRGADAVVNLCGESIAAGRWTRARKESIRNSRVASARLLAEAMARLDEPPRAYLCASAIGWYGDRGNEPLDETAPPGEGFLCEVCQQWEAACDAARNANVRVVHLRIGVVLDRRGGMLARLLPIYRLGLGGRVGSGRQWVSWIALSDVISAIQFLIDRRDLAGPVNLVSPEPVRQADFARTLGRLLRRPAILPTPAWAVELLAGEMGRRLALESTRVVPAVLERSGFRFAFPQLERALHAALRSRGS